MIAQTFGFCNAYPKKYLFCPYLPALYYLQRFSTEICDALCVLFPYVNIGNYFWQRKSTPEGVLIGYMDDIIECKKGSQHSRLPQVYVRKHIPQLILIVYHLEVKYARVKCIFLVFPCGMASLHE